MTIWATNNVWVTIYLALLFSGAQVIAEKSNHSSLVQIKEGELVTPIRKDKAELMTLQRHYPFVQTFPIVLKKFPLKQRVVITMFN